MGYFLALRITIPVTEITSLSKNIARGNYQLRLPEVRNDELGVLVKAINELALNVEQTIDQVTVSRNRLAAVLTGVLLKGLWPSMQSNNFYISTRPHY